MDRTFIYLIGSPTGPLKIGISSNPPARFRALQNASTTELSLHGTWQLPSVDARAVERLIHWLLRDLQIHGEWFDLRPKDAVETIVRAIADYEAGARAGRIESSRGRVGRPALDNKPTLVRLPPEQRSEIECLVGARGMAAFIRDAIADRLEKVKTVASHVIGVATMCRIAPVEGAPFSYPASSATSSMCSRRG